MRSVSLFGLDCSKNNQNCIKIGFCAESDDKCQHFYEVSDDSKWFTDQSLLVFLQLGQKW